MIAHPKRPLIRMLFIGNTVLLTMVLFAWTWWLILDGASARVTDEYGKRRGMAGAAVNGTTVFAKMFSAEGHTVSTWKRLSPRLARSQTIVWTPDSFALPSDEESDYLEQWLADEAERTLIYVARDYDATLDYWRGVAANATGSDYVEIRRALARAIADHFVFRAAASKNKTCRWFRLEDRHDYRDISLSEGQWSDLVDVEAMNIEAASTLHLADPSSEYRSTVLLGSNETAFLVRIQSNRWPDGQILVLLNGSMTLNLPLVNHEHRKIAGRLIDACASLGRVTFLESNQSGLRILEKEPNAFTGMEVLTTWPTNAIFLHVILAGVLACLRVFPIFGRPKTIVDDRPSDFGQHIQAVGDLLAMSHDREAATEQIRQYRNLNLDGGSSLRKSSGGNPFSESQETRGL